MKNLNNTYIKKDTIFSKGPSSCAYNYTKFFLERHKNIKSFLDIGCGDGILMKLMNNKIYYQGIDADVGIKKRKKNTRIKYFKNALSSDKYLTQLNKKFDCVVLMDVLEHTNSFLKLFNIAMKKSSKYVLVGLPNEDYILSRLRFMIGQGIMTHGLEMIDKNPGHKHQWLIQYNLAKKLLGKYSKKSNFKLESEFFYVGQPQSMYKRILYKLMLIFLPKHIQMNNFCLIFKKK